MEWWAKKEAVEQEIKSHIESYLIDAKSFLPPKNMPVWYVSGKGTNLRLNDYGFKYYSEIHVPFKMEVDHVMTGVRMLNLLRIMENEPWFYERKYRSGNRQTQSNMSHTIFHWNESKNVSWVLCGKVWDTWIALNS